MTPHGPEEFAQERATLVSRLQANPHLATRIGMHIGRSHFFTAIDKGENFDDALTLATSSAISWAEHFREIGESGQIPEGSTAEEGTPWLLAEIDSGERAPNEASPVRKKVAELVLRQQVSFRKWWIPVSRKRRQQFRSGVEV